MAELQHKTPRKPRRTNLRRLPGWHRTGEIFYAVGFLTEYWLICLGRKAAAAAHAARDAAVTEPLFININYIFLMIPYINFVSSNFSVNASFNLMIGFRRTRPTIREITKKIASFPRSIQ